MTLKETLNEYHKTIERGLLFCSVQWSIIFENCKKKIPIVIHCTRLYYNFFSDYDPSVESIWLANNLQAKRLK